ncbi:hypothetical protein [Streptomyces cyaneogriseus]|uniref:hypothetical protein n=1 Tax=Streptomyces cyaneogriseus TaxID=68192 RepID=UPI000A43193E|nr:hypothetical protein [Streptomyces cyaneogriseus]
MPVFLLGVALGGLSGGVTFGLTADGHVAAIVGVIAAVLTWLGIAAFIAVDD